MEVGGDLSNNKLDHLPVPFVGIIDNDDLELGLAGRMRVEAGSHEFIAWVRLGHWMGDNDRSRSTNNGELSYWDITRFYSKHEDDLLFQMGPFPGTTFVSNLDTIHHGVEFGTGADILLFTGKQSGGDRIGSYALWGFSCAYEQPRWTVYVDVRNLTDDSYESTGSVTNSSTPATVGTVTPGDGRTYLLGVEFSM